MKEPNKALRAGLMGGIGGLVFSIIINYFILPIPETLYANALGNGISGLISGFMGGYLAIKKNKNNESNT